MAINTKKKQEDVDIDMTPMLDIVFIMLIFFIVTTVFVKQAGVDVNKTSGTTAGPCKNAYVFIAIDDKSRIHMDKTEVQPSEIKAKLNSLRVENPEGSVVIQADQDARAGVVLDVLDQARKTGAEVCNAIDSEK
ncbi:biopolymer transporter ExbD [Kangiella sp. HZ709]|uniref:ExbD/TolR family protein n=1 Tax=Kangiella sp. HZ709 TaxID=2666328 RepID=UPI0012AF8D55|nr:biopolymer transporter ExbD [Kangiella sp. HZ709]MRX28478.1 biopolymer transporter ExbD [Kangiella sp. HZ709]